MNATCTQNIEYRIHEAEIKEIKERMFAVKNWSLPKNVYVTKLKEEIFQNDEGKLV